MYIVDQKFQYTWIMSSVLGQRSDCGTVLTSLTAIVDVVTVMMQEFVANQVCTTKNNRHYISFIM